MPRTMETCEGSAYQIHNETLGAKGVHVTSKQRHGWSAVRKYPAIQQLVVRDTAGAGDWLTAGILYSLLLDRNTTGCGELEAPIEYGQRLSAISLAFDGPQGALTALGGKTIIQMAESLDPFEVLYESSALVTASSSSPSKGTNQCSLCLTELPSLLG